MPRSPPPVRTHQMPSTSQSMGSTMTASIWKTSVRRKDTAADTAPLFSCSEKGRDKNIVSCQQEAKGENMERMDGHVHQPGIIPHKDPGKQTRTGSAQHQHDHTANH